MVAKARQQKKEGRSKVSVGLYMDVIVMLSDTTVSLELGSKPWRRGAGEFGAR